MFEVLFPFSFFFSVVIVIVIVLVVGELLIEFFHENTRQTQDTIHSMETATQEGHISQARP